MSSRAVSCGPSRAERKPVLNTQQLPAAAGSYGRRLGLMNPPDLADSSEHTEIEPMTTTLMEFLQALYPDPIRPGRLWIRTSSHSSGKQRSHWVHTLGEAATEAYRQRRSRDAFFGIALHDPRIARKLARTRWPRVQEPSLRGCFDSAVALPALWAEIEPADSESSSKQEAYRLLRAISVPPSIIVHTGTGYQVYWLLRELWLLDTEADRAEAKHWLRRVQGALDRVARPRGWRVDQRGDLARLLRCPNTLNLEGPAAREITLRHFPGVPTPGAGRAGDHRYELADFAALPEPPEESALEHLLGDAAPLSSVAQPVHFEPIVTGCAWLRQGVLNSHRLPVREWQLMIRIAGCCVIGGLDGRQLVHRLSEQHPGYSAHKTGEQLVHVLRHTEPPACRWIARHLSAGQKHCAACEHFGRSGSPLDLGRPVVSPQLANLPPTLAPGGPHPVRGREAREIRIPKALPGEAIVHHDLVIGLAELLSDLSGVATAREIVEHLAHSHPRAYPRLRAALAELFRHLGRERLPSPLQLSGALRSHRSRAVQGVCLEHGKKTYRGVGWTVCKVTRAQSPAETRSLGDPEKEPPHV